MATSELMWNSFSNEVRVPLMMLDPLLTIKGKTTSTKLMNHLYRRDQLWGFSESQGPSHSTTHVGSEGSGPVSVSGIALTFIVEVRNTLR
jgi:hypothetical protein